MNDTTFMRDTIYIQNIALDAADSETMPVLLSWVYGQKEQAAKSITSPLILQRVKYLAKVQYQLVLTTLGLNDSTRIGFVFLY